MKNTYYLTIFLFLLLSCSNDEHTENEPIEETPDFLWVYDNEGADWFVGPGHENSKGFDLDLDGVNDIRIINETVNLGSGSGDLLSVAWFSLKQIYKIEILNSKLSLAVIDQDTYVRELDGNGDSVWILVGGNPGIANVLAYDGIGTDVNGWPYVDGSLEYTTEDISTLLYINHFEYDWQNIDYIAPIYPFGEYVDGYFTYPANSYQPDFPILGQDLMQSGYIGFRILNENNAPCYGFVKLNFYNTNWVPFTYGSEPSIHTTRWYQVNVEVESFGIWTIPNKPAYIDGSRN